MATYAVYGGRGQLERATIDPNAKLSFSAKKLADGYISGKGDFVETPYKTTGIVRSADHYHDPMIGVVLRDSLAGGQLHGAIGAEYLTSPADDGKHFNLGTDTEFIYIGANNDTISTHFSVAVVTNPTGSATKTVTLDNPNGTVTLIGGGGRENLVSVQGHNLIRASLHSTGDTAITTIRGGSGHDTLIAGNQTHIYAGTGVQTLVGGKGKDTLDGRGDHSSLTFEARMGGHESLIGGEATNHFYIGHGQTTVLGGSGSNTIYLDDKHATISAHGSTATITFTDNSDKVTIKGVSDVLHHIKFD